MLLYFYFLNLLLKGIHPLIKLRLVNLNLFLNRDSLLHLLNLVLFSLLEPENPLSYKLRNLLK